MSVANATRFENSPREGFVAKIAPVLASRAVTIFGAVTHGSATEHEMRVAHRR